jgi:cytochrome c biogenesis protein CcdA/thiol-disulfide isomerase/thioredoxin
LATLVLIGLVGGLITGVSPCVLPVIPVVFLAAGARSARTPTSTRPRAADPPNRRPYLVVAGLVVSFSAFTLLGTLVLSALPVPKDTIRWAGLVALVVLGVAMMFPRVEAALERPFSRVRTRRVASAGGFGLGLALGAVYVPCAGPVLAAITVAGATERIGVDTVALTLAFAVGVAIPLLVFALAGRGVAERVRAFRTRQRAIRTLAGAVVVALGVALVLNVPDALQRAIPDYTAGLNSSLGATGSVSKVLGQHQAEALAACAQHPIATLQECGPAPAIRGIQVWLNTPHGSAFTLPALVGKVVLVDFWAYSCINCQRAITHVTAWYDAYRADGLVVIGVHTPEYAFEHVPANVAAGASRLHITYPVALDNSYTTWNDFGNDSWPAEYLIDSTGQVRHVAVGEGDYGTTESMIRQLLLAADPALRLPPVSDIPDTTPTSADQTPETYLGGERADAYDGAFVLGPGTKTFHDPSPAPPDQFGLTGTWTVGAESLTAVRDAAIDLTFVASDVYLDVGGNGTVTATVDGTTTTYRVAGAPDIYTLVDHPSQVQAEVEVRLSPGLSAYSFTFG